MAWAIASGDEGIQTTQNSREKGAALGEKERKARQDAFNP